MAAGGIEWRGDRLWSMRDKAEPGETFFWIFRCARGCSVWYEAPVPISDPEWLRHGCPYDGSVLTPASP